MNTHAAIVREARTWVGTRWQHQQSNKRAGTDCAGLVMGVGINCGLIASDWRLDPQVRDLLRYGRLPFDGRLEAAASRFLEPITEQQAGPGDVVLMEFGGVPHHAAILGDYHAGGLSIIHAYAKARRVVETRLDDSLRARIVSWFRYPGVQA
jgi:cell wall-associated NlpC family hydrolase